MVFACMQEAGLNEVFTGGLSSYSIVNMVMAHLQSMGYPLPTLPDVSGPPEAASHLSAAMSTPNAPATAPQHKCDVGSNDPESAPRDLAQAQSDSAEAASFDGWCEQDVGTLLLGFLHSFGVLFDYTQEAVSVREVIPFPAAPRLCMCLCMLFPHSLRFCTPHHTQLSIEVSACLLPLP